MSTLERAETKLIKDGNEETAQTLESFENRWRFAVFPAMVAFVVLSAFGFYLIYGMLQRMEQLATDVSRLTQVISETLPAMQTNVSTMSNNMTDLNSTIAINFPALKQDVSAMSTNMKNMSTSTSSLAVSTQNMGYNVGEMNRNISKPLSFMNKMMPFSKTQPSPPRPVYYYQ